MAQRRCTKTGCQQTAVATLTYVYADSTAVLGPLAPEHFPGTYDLCRQHCDQLSAPRGWEVVRLPDGEPAPAVQDDEDLMALANAVREVGLLPEELGHPPTPLADPFPPEGGVVVLAEKGHLKVIADRGQQGPSTR
ncbi:DUF3499 domain-containing protein [Luteococcus sp. Sow4_B9]|uniref:DUF3499 domain-containing protein n=1 Tax=Luteococcus sp. Sow4_B9 TaxID=3438792 RepID=UPI003F96152C